MIPFAILHRIGKDRHDTIRPYGNLSCHLFQQSIGINTSCQCFRFFCITKSIPKPSHDQAGEKSNTLCLRKPLYHMRIDTQSHIFRRDNRGIDVDDLLPKASPQYGTLAFSHHTQSCRTELNIAATHHNFRPLGESCLITRSFRHFTDDLRRLIDRREDLIFETDSSGLSCFPLSIGERKDPRRSCIGGIGSDDPRELRQNPVTDHRERGGFLINIRSILFDPEQTRQCPQSKSLTRLSVELLFDTRKLLFEFSHLRRSTRIDIGNTPKLPALRIIEDDTLTHRRSRDSQDLIRGDIRPGYRFTDTPRSQFPIFTKIKIHRVRHPCFRQMRPLPLSHRDLPTRLVENHRTDRPCPRINCH